jgi:1,4-dihydroxy-2-naphthoate polyprenyltransferase
MWRVWFLAARPKTLLASVCPVAIGTALAERDGGFHALAAVAALLGAVSIQVGTNFSNDYFDFHQGADTVQRKGPTRAVQAGLVSPASMLAAAFAAFLLTALVCVYLVARAGWPLAVVGAISILCGVWYTASRFSLAYLGLGDLFVLVFFGPVAVAGTHFVQALHFSTSAAVAGLAPGLISVGILVVNNLRDIHEDAQAQKRTLAVRWGAAFARWEYMACMLGTTFVPIALWKIWPFPVAILAASAAILPGFYLAQQLWHREGPELNPLLGKTAGVLLLFTLVFSLACVVA